MLQGLGVYLDVRCAILSKRALIPCNDSCHVNYNAHKLSVPYINFPALVETSIIAVSSYSDLKGCI